MSVDYFPVEADYSKAPQGNRVRQRELSVRLFGSQPDYFPIEADYSKARQSIRDLAEDPWNYSDHDPEKPTQEQINAALAGLGIFARASLPEPAIMLQEDGTFCAYWYTADEAYVSIDLESDRCFIWVMADTSGEQSGQFHLGQAIPEVILDTLKK